MIVSLTVTQLLSLFFGLYFLFAGIGMLMDRETVPSMFEAMVDNHAIGFSIGLIAFVVGAVIVSIHSTWNGILESIITLFGWVALFEGILMLAFRKWFLGIFAPFATSNTLISFFATLAIVMGVAFVWAGVRGL